MLQTKWFISLLLIIILVVAAGLRFYSLNWDGGIFAHPDERSTVAFYAPTIKWPENSADWLNPRTSTLNPFWNVETQERRSYTYGHFPLYTLVVVAYILNGLAPLAISLGLPAEWVQFLATAQSGQGYALIGRALSALADLGTVYLMFLIGRRLYGIWGGLLAAALSTFTVLQIQLAHFFAVDPITTAFTMLALYGAVRLYDRQSIGAAMLSGVGVALAIASKFSALPIVFIPIVAGYLAIRQRKSNWLQAITSKDAPPNSYFQSRMIALVILALSISLLIFIMTSPFVLLDFGNFRRAVLDEQGNMVSGVADFPFTRQYRNTPAYWYFIDQQLRWGMGWPLGLLGLAGTLWVIYKTLRGQAQVGEILSLLWIILYFGPTGLFLAKFMRYMLPIVPFLTLFGAGLIVALWQYRPSPKPSTYKPAVSQDWANSEMASVEPTSGALASPISQSPIPPGPPSSILYPPHLTAFILAVVILAGSAFWTLAFVNGVYRTEHSWITFSRWIYANVPDGACIAYEHWDDRMPTSLPEPNAYPEAHHYRQPQLPMYDDDTQSKYELLRSTLMNCDYIALATNRLWRTIPRLPERYPMSARYYEALFSGQLGFELIYSVETPPRLGRFSFDTQPADESFTVYDHPKPMLFKKSRQLDPAEWDALLGNTWQGAILGYIGAPTLLMRLRDAGNDLNQTQSQPTENDKSLLLDSPIDQLPPVDDYRWNEWANRSSLVAILTWWLAFVLIGLLASPLLFSLGDRLPDRGYALSKSLGLLLIGYFVWLNSSMGWLGNTMPTAIIAVIGLSLISLTIFRRNRPQLLQFWRSQYWQVVTTEILFGLVYLLFVYLRVLNPDLWHPWLGGEKMIEIGFLNAIVKSADMPPYDPFFAGGIINYYYYGLFLVGVLIKLTGIQPSIAFNLAVPSLAALTASNAFSLAGNLATVLTNSKGNSLPSPWKTIPAGLLATLFIVFMGNLEGSAQFMRNLANLSVTNFDSAIPGLSTLILAIMGFTQVMTGEALATYNYWDPTRVIPETINEFPFFSFLFADLHPHMIGIPFTILFLSLAYNWLRPTPASRQSSVSSYQLSVTSNQSAVTSHTSSISNLHASRLSSILHPLSSILRWLILPFILGALAVINTWDLPTYLGLMVTAFLLNRYRQGQRNFTWRQAVLLLILGGLFAGALLVVTYLLYAPFFANYQALDVGLGLVHTQTPLDQHLKIWGFFLFVVASWLWLSLLYPHSRNSLLRAFSLILRRWNVWPHFSGIYRAVVKHESDSYQLGLWSIPLVFILIALLILLGYQVPPYLLPLVLLALALLFRREISAANAYLCLLAFTGLLILLGVEFFFLRDFLGGGDYYRMNTLFKFFIQVWVIFGIVVAVVLPQIWSWAWQWRSLPLQIVWRGLAMILLLAGLIYPIFGTRTRVDDRFPDRQNRPPIGTLDGLAYMRVGVFEWPAGNPIQLQYDYEAIRWLQDHVEGTPIIAEAKIGYYREGGMRVAAYTGLPSILGGLHQNEQRYASQIGSRDLVVNEFWYTPDPNRALQLMDQLGITYLYIGQIERAVYGVEVEDKFRQLVEQGKLEIVFENDLTRVYKRKT
jgi:YYY domain-containing protein